MPVSKDYIAHALDLLSLAGRVSARAMFGGAGLYLEGAMFGLLDDDELYLKADDETRATFEAAGCAQWVYPSPKGPMAMSYYRPPAGALDDGESMLPWARLAIAAARRAQAQKLAKATRKKPGAALVGKSSPPAKNGKPAKPKKKK